MVLADILLGGFVVLVYLFVGGLAVSDATATRQRRENEYLYAARAMSLVEGSRMRDRMIESHADLDERIS